jgi:hypothetical protein
MVDERRVQLLSVDLKCEVLAQTQRFVGHIEVRVSGCRKGLAVQDFFALPICSSVFLP